MKQVSEVFEMLTPQELVLLAEEVLEIQSSIYTPKKYREMMASELRKDGYPASSAYALVEEHIKGIALKRFVSKGNGDLTDLKNWCCENDIAWNTCIEAELEQKKNLEKLWAHLH